MADQRDNRKMPARMKASFIILACTAAVDALIYWWQGQPLWQANEFSRLIPTALMLVVTGLGISAASGTYLIIAFKDWKKRPK
jgi:hypothetical protein